uniref:Pseudo n=1 Tax=Avian endogenous retrovirus EAV-HP TaxID=93465 RepID=Q6A2B1_9RETR|nr:pseudo [Avian endogenous retrovirus EAV-HP]
MGATVCQLSAQYAIPLRWKPDTRPVWVDQWPLPKEKLDALQTLVARELRLGHIEPSLSRWNTPVFVIQKKSGAFRLLHDLRAVNSQLIPFGVVQQGAPVLSAVPEEWEVTAIDLKDCFFSIPLAEQDREAFAFTVPVSNNQRPTQRYQWRVLPQGMACSPTICQMVVGKILGPLHHTSEASECIILHYMDDLLLAAPTLARLQDLETCVISLLTKAGFTVSSEKIQRGSGVQFLGYKFDEGTVRPTGVNITPRIRTLWDVQKLVGALQWIRGALGIPPRLMQPFYDQLKGSDPREPRTFTPDMSEAWDEIVTSCLHTALSQYNCKKELEVAVCKCDSGATGLLGQDLGAKPQPLWWNYSVQPVHAFTSWLEVLAKLICKCRLSAVRIFGQEPSVIYLPRSFRDTSPLPEPILLALVGSSATVTFTDSLSIFELARPMQLSLHCRVQASPVDGPTLFTDASSSTGQGAVVWGRGSCWKSVIFQDVTASVQILEVRAVALALRLWPTIPCNIVTDSAFAAKLLLSMGQEGISSTEAAMVLEDSLCTRTAPVAVMHVRSHSEVPGFFSEGNAAADRAAGTHVFTLKTARELHSTLHIGARALSRTCGIPLTAARDVVQACPHCNSAPAIGSGVNPRGVGPLQIWQTDFTWEDRFSPRRWLAVTVDTASTALVATQHAKANSTSAQAHWAVAIAILGLPAQIKTDNGSCFTSRSTQEWLSRWGIQHVTGIPGNSQGQAIVERANRLLKDKIRVLGEGEGYKDKIPVGRQPEILARALYALNHFERGDAKRTPVEKHWQPKILEEGPLVKVKTNIGVWEPGWRILVWGRGYAAVKHAESGRVVWVPARKVKPDLSKEDDNVEH